MSRSAGGRFQSVPLLDQAAVIAAMAYVDLNPIRAAMADPTAAPSPPPSRWTNT